MPAQGLTVEPLHQRRVVGQPPRPLRVSGGVPPYRVIGSEGEWQRGAGGWTRSAWRRSGSREVTVIDGAGEQVVVTIETMPLLSISPARADLMPGGTLQLTATGGSGITSWHAEAGRIEGEGASVSYQSPEVNGVYQVTVGDQEGQLATATINVAAGVWVTPSRLMLSPGERHVLQATGGTPPYRATASAGTVVVEGGGVAYTAPSVAGNYLISITDALGEDAQVRVSVRRPLKVRPLELFLEPGEEALLDLSGVVGAAIATAGRGELVTVNDRRLRYIAPAERGNDTVTIRDDEGQLVQVTVQVSSDRLFISPGQEFLRPGEPLDLRAVGGSPPYTWRVVGSGDLEPIAEATRPASSSGESAQGEEDGEGDGGDDGGDDGEADGEADGADEQGEAADSAANPSPQNRVRFTAPQESGQSEIRISDSLGREGSALVTIRRGDLATAPQLLLLQPGGEASISALFGIPDYRWSVERGQLASASGETIEYTAPDTPGVVEDWVELEDASGAVVRMRVVISKQGGRRNIVDLYAGEDGRLDEEELQRAVDDYFAAKGWLTREELYQLLDADTQ